MTSTQLVGTGRTQNRRWNVIVLGSPSRSGIGPGGPVRLESTPAVDPARWLGALHRAAA